MCKKILLAILSITLGYTPLVSAQDIEASKVKIGLSLHVGYNFGGLAPVPLPNTIRKIESYSPGFSPVLGAEFDYSIDSKWGLGAGIGIDRKAMSVTDRVQYFHTQISMDGASLEGDFSGTNTTHVRNVYLAIPLFGTYTTENHWRFKGGVYLAYLMDAAFEGSVSDGYLRKGNSLGEKVDVIYAEFNFKEDQKRFDFGMHVGAEKELRNRLSVAGNLKWGLIPVFPRSFTGMDFNMYNIFFDLGLNYRLQ